MPAIYISKYNRFVDNIINRINHLLGKSYDPVRVKLQALETTTKKKKTTTKNNTKKLNKRRRNNKRRNNDVKNKMEEVAIARSTESESREPAFILISKNTDENPKIVIKNTTSLGNNRATNTNKAKKNKKKRKNNNHRSKGTKKSGKKAPKARATLFGLSSIRRDGDVTVNMMADHTTVKTDFVLGPLTLRVEREVRDLVLFV